MSVKSSHRATHQQADGLVYLPFARKFTVTQASLDANKKLFLPVEKGQTVLGVSHHVTTAFNGTTPSLTVGDGSDADGYIPAANVSIGTVDNFYFSLGGAGAYAPGKYYPASGTIVLDYNNDCTEGEAEVMVYFAGSEAD
jgi:hypothetical protein